MNNQSDGSSGGGSFRRQNQEDDVNDEDDDDDEDASSSSSDEDVMVPVDRSLDQGVDNHPIAIQPSMDPLGGAPLQGPGGIPAHPPLAYTPPGPVNPQAAVLPPPVQPPPVQPPQQQGLFGGDASIRHGL